MQLHSILLPGDLRISKPDSWHAVPRPAIFLDFDGTLWPDLGPGSILSALEVPGRSALLLSELSKKGYLLIGITNQTFFGYHDKVGTSQILNYRRRLNQLLKNFCLNSIYVCHHHPSSKLNFLRKNCENRKPQSGSIQMAIQDYFIDIPKSYIIGDRITDIFAGQSAQIPNRCLIINSQTLEWNVGTKPTTPSIINFRVYRDLQEVLEVVLRRSVD